MISAKTIKEAREKAGKTQAEQAKIAGVGTTKYKSWEENGISEKEVRIATFVVCATLLENEEN